MTTKQFAKLFAFLALLILLTACGAEQDLLGEQDIDLVGEADATPVSTATVAPTPTPQPPRVLSICMGAEPASLFPYADVSAAGRAIRQAIYDGPIDIDQGEAKPVILQRSPSLENGDAQLRPVEVEPGDVIMDNQGEWATLEEGVSYRPSGCTNMDCAQVYQGEQTVTMDTLAVRFFLKPEVLWSDSTPLTAEDSVYAFSVARDFYGDNHPILPFTQSYTALDSYTIEWVGIPGYQAPYVDHFFSPLPEHLWGQMSVDQLLTTDQSARLPVGWGPYSIEEWVEGDHIRLRRNPDYFRAGEGLPAFDHLVFRFVQDGDAAVDALLAGECDLVHQTALDLEQAGRLLEAQDAGEALVSIQPSGALEQAVFGILPYDEMRLSLFKSPQVRQAVAMCIDRQAIIDQVLMGLSPVPDSYFPPDHWLHAADLPTYTYDPAAALEMLAAAGWVDLDQDSSTPLTSVGVAGVPDDTRFTFTYLVPDGPQRLAVAEMVQESLARCGIQAEIESQAWQTLLGPGPDSPVFGRAFDMAQFAWGASSRPPCFLYQSDQTPGPYPDYPRGWGGGNPGGYTNPEFDRACQEATYTLPDLDVYTQANAQAQTIFLQNVPVVPLYWHQTLLAARPDMCDQAFDGFASLERFEYGDGCEQ